ncbi:unnamed protein product, partial [Iphiclides podalirius]
MQTYGMLLFLVVSRCACVLIVPAPEVVNAITERIALMMFKCAETLYPGMSILEQVVNYWRSDTDIMDINFGCVAMCSLIKLNLYDGKGQLLEKNMTNFVLAKGADDETVVRLVEVFRNCRPPPAAGFRKNCTDGLHVMKCFRNSMYRLGWAPIVHFGLY